MHSYPLTILEKHLDTFGHVNNATYLELFEEARWDWITKGGYGMEHIKKTGQGPTILEITMSFKRELLLRQEVVIRSRMTAYEKKVGILLQEIYFDDTLCTRCNMLVALFDTHMRKLIQPTEAWLKALGIPEFPFKEKSD